MKNSIKENENSSLKLVWIWHCLQMIRVIKSFTWMKKKDSYSISMLPFTVKA